MGGSLLSKEDKAHCARSVMNEIQDIFGQQPAWAQALIGLALLVLVCVAVNFVIKQVILRAAASWLDRKSRAVEKAAARLANIVPAVVVIHGIALVPHLSPGLVTVVSNVAGASIVLNGVIAISQFLTYLNEIYDRRPDAARKPIKGYIQVVKIVLFVIATILMLAVLMEQSPLLLFSGLGAMAAVLMLVFQDTILSLVASVQLSSNDMLRVGDWIEVPGFNADGDVVDIALHTVKVQNWDKTITTIPTHKLISGSFINWRGMQETGTRRIKRALFLDQASMRFLEPAEIERLRRFRLIEQYLAEKHDELQEWNGPHAEQVNRRRITNIGTFRAYVSAYLQEHPGISSEATLMVRQLAPTPEGLPLELYCFTATIKWAEYEGIQADIFDHLLAILPEFGLRVFQQPSGTDMRDGLAGEWSGAEREAEPAN